VGLTLISFATWPRTALRTWRASDYAAYKVARLAAGRRIAGSAWISSPGGDRRVSNASRDPVLQWLADRAAAPVLELTGTGLRPALVPFPGWLRTVGSPPSGSRALAQELSTRTGLRLLDVLRWRQRMNGVAAGGPQFYFDNLVSTGSPVRVDCVLVADVVTAVEAVAAAAALLSRMGGRVVLAIAAARGTRAPAGEPFATAIEVVGEAVALSG
jgi:hypothetical protein